MTDYTLPPTLAVVVDSEVLGKTAVSVPLSAGPGAAPAGGRPVVVHIEIADIEDALAEKETSYIESHVETPQDDVSIAAIRLEALQQLEGMLTAAELARRMGYSRMKDGEKVPDRDKVLYTLGITSDKTTIPYDVAADFAAALGVDPIDVGL